FRFYINGLAAEYARRRRGIELPWGDDTLGRVLFGRAGAFLRLAGTLARAGALPALARLPSYAVARTLWYARGVRDGARRYGAACRPSCTPRAGETRPNVVLVTIDTLRAGHLACYGSRTVQTPELDRLASEGARFERCYAQSHLTVPSHLTIFTSLPPAEHGVLDNGWKLRRRVEALPAVFARAGYRTAAFVSAKHVGPEGTLGAALGHLDVYEAPHRIDIPFRAEETNRRFLRWVRGACRGPFFAWIHYWDPHMPYTPPRPFD